MKHKYYRIIFINDNKCSNNLPTEEQNNKKNLQILFIQLKELNLRNIIKRLLNCKGKRPWYILLYAALGRWGFEISPRTRVAPLSTTSGDTLLVAGSLFASRSPSVAVEARNEKQRVLSVWEDRRDTSIVSLRGLTTIGPS